MSLWLLDIDPVNVTISVSSLILTLMVLGVQNREGLALHAKMDQIIKSLGEADDAFVELEQQNERDILAMRERNHAEPE